MPKLKRCFFVGAMISLMAGFTGSSSQMIFNLGPPLGVALIGMFLIFHMLEGESALFDRQNGAPRPAQHRADRRDAPGGTGVAAVQRSTRPDVNQEAGPRATQEPGQRAGAPAF